MNWCDFSAGENNINAMFVYVYSTQNLDKDLINSSFLPDSKAHTHKVYISRHELILYTIQLDY